MEPLTVQQLIESLHKMMAAGKIKPDYVFGFSHDEAGSTADHRVYPLDPERVAVADSYKGAPKLVVFFGRIREE